MKSTWNISVFSVVLLLTGFSGVSLLSENQPAGMSISVNGPCCINDVNEMSSAFLPSA